MATATQQAVYPLLTTGLSRSFTQWLRTAGISFKSYVPGTSLARFFSANRDRVLLFDSRNPSSRYEAETALPFGCEILDVSPSATDADDAVRIYGDVTAADWTLHLSRLLRRSGRIWLRVHDLPAGYEAVVFNKGILDPAKDRMILEGTSPLSTQQSTYIPQPHFGQEHLLDHDDFELGSGDAVRGCWWKSRMDPPKCLNPQTDASIWSPTAEEFDAWMTFRNNLQLEATVSDDAFRIEVPNLHLGQKLPLLELWRENHVARFPIGRSPMVLKRSGMVYEQAAGRHPAGLFLSKGIGHYVATSRSESWHKKSLNL